MIHHAEMIVGIRIPRPVDLERARGLAGVGVPEVGRDAAILSLELLDRIEGIGQPCDRRVQPAARDEQQRVTGAKLLVVNANGTFFVKGPPSS